MVWEFIGPLSSKRHVRLKEEAFFRSPAFPFFKQEFNQEIEWLFPGIILGQKSEREKEEGGRSQGPLFESLQNGFTMVVQ